MHNKFAITSNVKAFYDAYGRLNQRGAEEASWLLAIGLPGYGKTRTVQNFAIETRGIYVRGKANWTASWMLHEIADSMGLDTQGTLRSIFARLIAAIVEQDAPIVVDEARNMLHDTRLLETLRDLSDTTGARVILSGEEFVLGRLTNRFPQIRSRISEVVTFRAATLADVKSCCATLSEVPFAEDLAARILKDSRGFYREIKNAIKSAEVVGKRDGLQQVVDGPAGQEWHPVDSLPRDQRRFRFDEFNRLRLLDWDNLIMGELLPDRKFIVHTFGLKDGDPYGRGLGSMLWWNAFFKRENQQAWLIHNEKFAVPTVHGTYPAEASDEEQNEVYAAARSFSTDAAIVSPQGTEFKLIETARAAGADTFKVMRDAQNEDIDAVVLGSTYAVHAGALDGGSGAGADQDDRLELAQADGNDLAMTLNRTLIAWIVEINLPGARPPMLKWLVDAEEDLSARATRDAEIESMGFEPSEEYINATYGGEWTKKAELAPVITDEANFAQPASRIAPTTAIADRLAPQLAQFADPVVAAWVGEFRKIIESSATLEEAQDRLIDLYSQMDGTHFAQTFAAALQVADLAGRADTKHGA